MKNLLTLLGIILLSKYSLAQADSSVRLLRSFPAVITDAALDNLENLYLLTPTDQLKKYNAAGDSLAVYNNVRKFGKVHSMDVSNPLRVLLYYKDFSTIVILDRLLSVRSAIDLRKKNILQVGAIGLSYDNNIWLYDEYDHKLKRIAEDGSVLLETPDFRMLFNQSVSPRQIIDQNNTVYLYDPENGLFLFDRYGTFKRKVPIKNWKAFGVTDKYILGITANNKLGAYNLSTLMQDEFVFPSGFAAYTKFSLVNNKLLAVSKDGVFIYELK